MILNIIQDSYSDNDLNPVNVNIKGNLLKTPIETVFNKCKLSDIPKYPNKSFYCIFNPGPRKISKLMSSGNPILSSRIIDYWNKYKNFNIIFINNNEIETFSSIKDIDNWTKKYHLNQSQLWIVNNNKKLYEHKKILNSNINFHIAEKLFSIILQDNISEKDFVTTKNGKFFTCHNRKAKLREHRLVLLLYLKKKNILFDVDWSILENDYQHSSLNKYLTEKEINDLTEEIDYFKNINYKKNEIEKNIEDFDDPHKLPLFYDKTFKNSYFNIVTETGYISPEDIHISEKSFRPFYYFQFPLILATYKHLDYLKKIYNFDIFDDIINHDYDNEPDNKLRLKKFVNEIERINNNKEFFIDFYKNNKDRFIENYRKFKNLSTEKDNNILLNKLIKHSPIKEEYNHKYLL